MIALIIFLVLLLVSILVFVILVIIKMITIKKGEIPTNEPTKITNEPEKSFSIDISIDDSITNEGYYLIVDTETTGFPKSIVGELSDSNNWPFILQIAWLLLDREFNLVESGNHYLDYKGDIPFRATEVNHIDKQLLKMKGEPTKEVLSRFIGVSKKTNYIVAHNAQFDINIINSELYRNNLGYINCDIPIICTMKSSKDFVQATTYNGRLKNPRLDELYLKCYYPEYADATLSKIHDADFDTLVTAKSLQYLINEKIINEDGSPIRSARKSRRTEQEILIITNETNKPNRKQNKLAYTGHEHISGDVLKPNTDNVINKNNFFFGKKVVVSGLYDKWPDRSEIARELQILGADIDTGVTHRTNILIAGRDVGAKKVEAMNKHIEAGKNAVIINEMELIRLLDEIKIINY